MFHRHPWLPYILLAVAGAAVSLIMLGIASRNKRHPWLPYILLSVIGVAASLIMLMVASRNTPESVPVENPGVVKP